MSIVPDSLIKKLFSLDTHEYVGPIRELLFMFCYFTDRHPEMFELLKTLPVDFYDIGVDKSSFFKRTRQPIIG